MYIDGPEVTQSGAATSSSQVTSIRRSEPHTDRDQIQHQRSMRAFWLPEAFLQGRCVAVNRCHHEHLQCMVAMRVIAFLRAFLLIRLIIK